MPNPGNKNPETQYSEFGSRDLFGIYSSFQNPDPDPGILGFFNRDFLIAIPIPGISGFSGVSDLA